MQNTIDLIPEDLSTKDWIGSMANDAKKQPIKYLFDRYQKSLSIHRDTRYRHSFCKIGAKLSFD